MDSQMTVPGSKKRSAPGSLPNLPSRQPSQQMQRFSSQWPMSDVSHVPASYPETSLYDNNMTVFDNNHNLPANDQFNQTAHASSTPQQLVRRPNNNLLVTTGPRKYDDLMDGSWSQFNGGQESGLEVQQQYPSGSDSIEQLEQRAEIASKERKQIPPFVLKLWSFVNPTNQIDNTDLIRWSERGDSFIVLDEDEFAKKLIPELFKHNNYASFVRQLNMYGFHKKVGLSDNSMKSSEKKNKSPSEYSNPYFRRGHYNLLWLIEKPKSGPIRKTKKQKMEDGGDGGSDEEVDILGSKHNYNTNTINQYPPAHQRAISAAPEQSGISTTLQGKDLSVVLSDIQKQQAKFTSVLGRMKQEHNDLYQQALRFQAQHDKHESSINAILTFLATVYRNNLGDGQTFNMGQLFANTGAQVQDQSQPQQRGSVVDMGDTYQQDQLSQQQQQQQQQPLGGGVSPLRRPQRLLMAPPINGSRSASPMMSSSRAATTTPRTQQQHPHQHTSASIEELADSPSESPKVKTEDLTDPNSQMLNLINTTNASTDITHNGQGSAQNNLEVLSNSIAHSPITPSQRNDMLQMMAKQTPAGVGSNTALISPSPPLLPNFDLLNKEADELAELSNMQKSIDASLQQVAQAVRPLTPSGTIPGFSDIDPSLPSSNEYFDSSAFMPNISPGGVNDIDPMNQWLNYNPSSFNLDNNGMEYPQWDTAVDGDGVTFDNFIGDGGVVDNGEERIVEEADTPEQG